MVMHDGDKELIFCDACKKSLHDVEDYYHECMEIQAAWVELFRCPKTRQGYGLRVPHWFPVHTCRECAIKLSPTVIKLADIWWTHIYNERLREAINERKRNKDNWPAKAVTG